MRVRVHLRAGLRNENGSETRESLDWTKLPEPLRYLAIPAEKYGQLQFEDRILDFLEDEITETEIQELKDLAKPMDRDWELIERWLDEYNIVKHREAALVYFTGNLIAHARDVGLEI